MGTAALFDIHGNLPALNAVLDELEELDVEQIVIGGDVVPGPMPRQTMERLLQISQPIHWIRGNGDRTVLEFASGEISPEVPEAYHPMMHWCAEQLTAEHRKVLESMPLSVSIELPGIGQVYFCHATPRSDNEIFTRNTEAKILRRVFGELSEKSIVCGHTHMQFRRKIVDKVIVNAGSIGMPFGTFDAQWLWIHNDIEMKSTSYDKTTAASQIKSEGCPGVDEWVNQYVSSFPDEATILEAFDRAAIKPE